MLSSRARRIVCAAAEECRDINHTASSTGYRRPGRLGASVVRYAFTVVDSHHLLLAAFAGALSRYAGIEGCAGWSIRKLPTSQKPLKTNYVLAKPAGVAGYDFAQLRVFHH